MVVAPSGSYGAAAVEVAEAGLFSGVFFSKVGKWANPNFRDAALPSQSSISGSSNI